MYERVKVRPIYTSEGIKWVGKYDSGGAVVFTQPAEEFKAMCEKAPKSGIFMDAWFDSNSGYFSFEFNPDYPDMEREVCAAEYLEER